MKTNVKFDRRVNIRMRATDLRIAWYAVGAAVLAHVVFFGVFDHRKPLRRGGETGSGVTMLSVADFPVEEREGFRNWLDYHDPRSFADCGFGDEVEEGVLREVRNSRMAKRPEAVIPVRAAAVGAFREVPGRKLAARMVPPPPPREKNVPKTSAAVGKVTDGSGRELPLGELKLPPRTPRTVGRTVLRVFNGGAPALLLDRSCGDGRLDGFAIRTLAFLARRDPAPEYICSECGAGFFYGYPYRGSFR